MIIKSGICCLNRPNYLPFKTNCVHAVQSCALSEYNSGAPPPTHAPGTLWCGMPRRQGS